MQNYQGCYVFQNFNKYKSSPQKTLIKFKKISCYFIILFSVYLILFSIENEYLYLSAYFKRT